MWYRRALCALGLCLVSMASQAETVRYTFSLPEITYAGATYAADSISFEGESLLPTGPWEFRPFPAAGENLNGFFLDELFLNGSSGSWQFSATNFTGNPAAGTVVGLFFDLADAGVPGPGTYASASAGRLIADGFTFVDPVVSGERSRSVSCQSQRRCGYSRQE